MSNNKVTVEVLRFKICLVVGDAQQTNDTVTIIVTGITNCIFVDIAKC